MNSYTIRQAANSDIDFLSEVVIEAEKSGTNRLGLATLFDLDEQQLHGLLGQMFDEEVDGCEFSVSSFLIAETDGKSAAAFGGWTENPVEPSAMLKSNLLAYTFGPERVALLKERGAIVAGVMLPRTPGTLQLEYLYVKPEHRGQRLAEKLIDALIARAKETALAPEKAEVQLFGNNEAARRIYERAGFAEKQRANSSHPETASFLPDATKLVMNKSI